MILQNVKLNWTKLIGEPRLNYSEDGYEWSVDVVVDKSHIKALEAENLGDYLREKNGETFFKYRRPSVRSSGEAANPVPVLDKFGKSWDPSVLIGNGTTADVQIIMSEMKRGKNKGKNKPTVIKVKVNDLVEYNAGEDFTFDAPASSAVVATAEEEWV
jgi:hypothetical protein